MSPAHRFSKLQTRGRIFFTSAGTTSTCVNWLGGQYTSTLARLAGWLAIFWLCLFAANSLKAQTPDPSPTDAPQPGVRPPLSPFPRYEDWSFLRDPAKRVDPYDRLKFIPLNDSGTIYLTLGLENRTEFQYLNNNDWGAGPQDHNGYVLERLMPDLDVRLGDHARVFITLAFDEIGGKNAVPRPGIDKDAADGHEGFVEFGGNLHDPHPGWDVIIGRQEIVLGTGRLLDDNEGVNVRSAFDGVRIGYDKPEGRIDLIAVKPVEINPGAWDDIPNPKITLWGLYASNVRWSPRFMTDVYFLDYDAKSATYGNESAREQRRMVGARYFNRLPGEPPRAGFDYNVETGFQWGTFGNRQIRAWGAGGNLGWTLPGPVWPVRFGFQADAISGDNGQLGTLGTFNAFFPRGAYFGPKFALIGPANLLSVQPQFVFHPLPNVTGTFEWIWFWRESTNDALYSFENVPIRPANLSSARFVGSQPNLEIRWAISEHFLAALNVAGFVTGEFLKQSPPSNAIAFFNLGLTYRF
jgi:alginate export protein